MKTGLLTFFVLGIIFLTVQCSSVKLSAPADADLEAAKKLYPNISLEDLKKGHEVYTTKCNRCHGLKNPTNYSSEQWTKIIGSMAPKAKLDENQKAMLTQYLMYARTTIVPVSK